MKRAITALVLLGLGAPCVAQAFANGDFETGSLDSWTVTRTTNGITHFEDVVYFDIDFSGPLGLSRVARFQVAQYQYNPHGTLEGIELTQMIELEQGRTYVISFNAATYVNAPGLSAGRPGDFSLIVNGSQLETWISPDAQSFTQNWSIVSASFTPRASASYSIGARILRGYLSPDWLFQKVDNFNIVPEQGSFVTLAFGALVLVLVRKR